MSESKTLAARWIAIPDQPPIESGVLEIAQGKIVNVERRRGQSVDQDFGDAIVLPGFVNAHTHLDLTGATNLTPPRLPFPDWLRDVIAYRRSRSAEQSVGDIETGIRQSLVSGTTLLGDISSAGASWNAIDASSLKAVVFHELLGLIPDRADAAIASAKEWLSSHLATARIRPGLSPHSPYSFRFDRLAELVQIKLPIAIHVAESLDELDLIAEHAGEFVPFLEELGVWDSTGLPALDGTVHPLQTAERLLFIHGNYLPGDAAIPTNATMVYCPRTHAAFDHPLHPFRDWLDRGIRVALGTDSLASNPDLSILAEARFVFSEHPDLVPTTLLDMISRNGAIGLGFPDCGAIAPGMTADLCVIPVPTSCQNPLESIFQETTNVQFVFSDGGQVV